MSHFFSTILDRSHDFRTQPDEAVNLSRAKP